MCTVDTVSYSIQNCWLLQFLLKPLNCYFNLLLQSIVLPVCSKPEGGFPLSRNFCLPAHIKFLCVNKTGNVWRGKSWVRFNFYARLTTVSDNFSLLHLNIPSLQCNASKLTDLLSNVNLKFSFDRYFRNLAKWFVVVSWRRRLQFCS